MLLNLLILIFTSSAYGNDIAGNTVSNAAQLDDAKEQLSLTKYNPIYFAYGEQTTKLQLSFKYQLIQKLPVYFGYTQLMFWNLRQDSKPFKDLNYNPEIFQRIKVGHRYLESFDFAPYEHISNGRDGEASRSMNRAYIRFNVTAPFSEGEIKMSVRLIGHYDLSQDNSDIYKYVGPLDLKFTVTQFVPWVFDKGEFYLRVFPGGSYAERWDLGGQEFGLSFRLGGAGLNSSIYLQYYNGYAESLLEYKRQSSQIRFGVIL